MIKKIAIAVCLFALLGILMVMPILAQEDGEATPTWGPIVGTLKIPTTVATATPPGTELAPLESITETVQAVLDATAAAEATEVMTTHDIQVGETRMVMNSEVGLNLRDESYTIIGILNDGDTVEITGGPFDYNGSTYWEVTSEQGDGRVAERWSVYHYLWPVPNDDTVIETCSMVYVDADEPETGVYVRSDAGQDKDEKGKILNGGVVLITGEPVVVGTVNWYPVQGYSNGQNDQFVEGWMAEQYLKNDMYFQMMFSLAQAESQDLVDYRGSDKCSQ